MYYVLAVIRQIYSWKLKYQADKKILKVHKRGLHHPRARLRHLNQFVLQLQKRALGSSHSYRVHRYTQATGSSTARARILELQSSYTNTHTRVYTHWNLRIQQYRASSFNWSAVIASFLLTCAQQGGVRKHTGSRAGVYRPISTTLSP